MPTQIKYLFLATVTICIQTVMHSQQNDSTSYKANDKYSFIRSLESHASLSEENEDTIYTVKKKIISHEAVENIEEGGETYYQQMERAKRLERQKIRSTVAKLKDSIALLLANSTDETSEEIAEEQATIEEETTEKPETSLQLGKLTTILSLALITILSLLTLSLYKNNNLRARANELLQNKNQELLAAKENAERASEAKVQFLSTITHELRTPLYAVTGLTHLLLEENPTASQKEHLNSLKFSGEYLLSLINNILDLNKLEAKKVELENTSFNLRKRINDVLIALGKSAKDRNNKLHYEFDESIPEKLKGDPLKVSQVLINLIGNSIKFTQNGDIWIRVNTINELENKIFLNFEIEDNGVGISEKKQQNIFDNFTQGSVQINRKFGGTGLGLSIVKNLLDLMGSEIKLESELGKGSKFTFDIKFDIYQDPKNSFVESAKQVDYAIMVNKNVLVVEDNKINQMITRKILEKNKMICEVADNGEMAVNMVQNNTYDLILMDIHMPGISGIEATKLIREFDNKIPIIALTAVTLNDNLNEFYDNGFDDIIPKPYKTEEFFTKLYKGFNKKNEIEEDEEENNIIDENELELAELNDNTETPELNGEEVIDQGEQHIEEGEQLADQTDIDIDPESEPPTEES